MIHQSTSDHLLRSVLHAASEGFVPLPLDGVLPGFEDTVCDLSPHVSARGANFMCSRLRTSQHGARVPGRATQRKKNITDRQQ